MHTSDVQYAYVTHSMRIYKQCKWNDKATATTSRATTIREKWSFGAKQKEMRKNSWFLNYQQVFVFFTSKMVWMKEYATVFHTPHASTSTSYKILWKKLHKHKFYNGEWIICGVPVSFNFNWTIESNCRKITFSFMLLLFTTASCTHYTLNFDMFLGTFSRHFLKCTCLPCVLPWTLFYCSTHNHKPQFFFFFCSSSFNS